MALGCLSLLLVRGTAHIASLLTVHVLFLQKPLSASSFSFCLPLATVSLLNSSDAKDVLSGRDDAMSVR